VEFTFWITLYFCTMMSSAGTEAVSFDASYNSCCVRRACYCTMLESWFIFYSVSCTLRVSVGTRHCTEQKLGLKYGMVSCRWKMLDCMTADFVHQDLQNPKNNEFNKDLTRESLTILIY